MDWATGVFLVVPALLMVAMLATLFFLALKGIGRQIQADDAQTSKTRRHWRARER
jgi:hypothetical protein